MKASDHVRQAREAVGMSLNVMPSVERFRYLTEAADALERVVLATGQPQREALVERAQNTAWGLCRESEKGLRTPLNFTQRADRFYGWLDATERMLLVEERTPIK